MEEDVSFSLDVAQDEEIELRDDEGKPHDADLENDLEHDHSFIKTQASVVKENFLRFSALHLADGHKFRETDIDQPSDEWSIIMRKKYHTFWLKNIRRVCALTLITLTWFEGPYSCEYEDGFPITCNLIETRWYLNILELFCLLYILFTSSCKVIFEGITPVSQRRLFNLFVSVSVFLSILCSLTSLYTNSIIPWLIRACFRPIYVADQFRSIRLLVLVHMRSSFQIFVPIVALLLLFILQFAAFGQYFLGEFLDGDVTRETSIPLLEAFSSSFVMSTTTNFPDVALPAYRKNFYSHIYFVFFMIVIFFLVLNVLTAIFYGNYRDASKNMMNQLVGDQTRQICRAFEILFEGEKNPNQSDPSRHYPLEKDAQISIATVKAVTKTLYKTISHIVPDTILYVLFIENQPDKTHLTQGEFGKYIEFLFRVHQKETKKLILNEQMKLIVNWLGKPWVSETSFIGKSLIFIFTSKWTEFFLAGIALTNFFTYEYGLRLNSETFIKLRIAFAVIYYIPIFFRPFLLGLSKYFGDKWYLFDTVLSQCIIAAAIVNYMYGSVNKLFHILICLRLLSAFRILYIFSKDCKMILDFVFKVGIITLPYFVLVYLWMYYWAIFGCAIFGGKITYPNADLEKLVGWNKDYYSLTFDDYSHAMVILFACIVINNWQYISWGFSVVLGYGPHFYFGIFYMTTALTMLRISLAFMLDAYFLLKDGRDDDLMDPATLEQLRNIVDDLSRKMVRHVHKSHSPFSVVKIHSLQFEKRGFYEAVQMFG